MIPHRRAIGKQGEDLAVAYLVQQEYVLVDRNVVFQWGEIDIIALYDGLWRCVEVKYRETTLFGMPEDAMTPRKIQTLLRSIEAYCLKKQIDMSLFRLDFLGILKLPDGTYEYRLIQDVN